MDSPKLVVQFRDLVWAVVLTPDNRIDEINVRGFIFVIMVKPQQTRRVGIIIEFGVR